MDRLEIERRPYLMENAIQHYAWGGKGENAFIPIFMAFKPEPGVAYAELWMGAHGNGPSSVMIHQRAVPLDRLIQDDPINTLGNRAAGKFERSLPFLMKILSAEEPLSIQAHPDKEAARMLHQKDPAHYPDENPKPEVAVALDYLDALIGFKSGGEMAETLAAFPELKEMIPEERPSAPAFYSGILKNAFGHPERVTQVNEAIKNRLDGKTGALTDEERLFLYLAEKYSASEAGVLMMLLLRRVRLKKGEGIAIGPGVPHAYLKGNIIECMTNSDNVVRAGLTPKFKDREALFQILDYQTDPIPVISGDRPGQDLSYQSPFDAFSLSKLVIRKKSKKRLDSGDAPQILLVTEGEIGLIWTNACGDEQEIKALKGRSLFLPASLGSVTIVSGTGAELFRVTLPDP
jgi:mannose-6-phosphate isomerase